MSLLRSLARPLRSVSSPVATRTVSARSNSSAPPKSDGERTITELLTARFKPSQLKVQDVSGGCGSFYAIAISSKEFKGIPTVKAHRLVNQELKEVIKDIHGLQLRTIAED